MIIKLLLLHLADIRSLEVKLRKSMMHVLNPDMTRFFLIDFHSSAHSYHIVSAAAEKMDTISLC